MSEKLIIILSGINVRKFDFLRYDVEEFKSQLNYNVQFHELIDYVYPGFSKVFTNTFQSENIKKFSNFEDWKNNIVLLKKKFGKNILIINEIDNKNFRSIKINYLIKKLSIKSIFFSNLDHPTEKSGSIFYNLKWLLHNLIYNRKKIKIYVEERLSTLIATILKLKPDFFLISGKESFVSYKSISNKIIDANSRDYNMHLKFRNKSYDRQESYGLFLEAPTPVHSKGDSLIAGEDRNLRGTPEKWLKSLNNFFSLIENKLNIKILIAPHPKVKHKDKYSKYYNGREVLSDGLHLAAKKAKLIITRDSQGASYATIYKIPTIFIYTDELLNKKNNFLRNQKRFANAFGLEPINIDDEISDEMLKKIVTFKNEDYQKYIYNYLTSRKDNKMNYEIISEIFNF